MKSTFSSIKQLSKVNMYSQSQWHQTIICPKTKIAIMVLHIKYASMAWVETTLIKQARNCKPLLYGLKCIAKCLTNLCLNLLNQDWIHHTKPPSKVFEPFLDRGHPGTKALSSLTLSNVIHCSGIWRILNPISFYHVHV